MALQIRPLKEGETDAVGSLPPEDWHFDFGALLRRLWRQPHSVPLAAELDGALVGVGQALCHGPVGWVGNIIVRPESRGQGVGTAITARLIEVCRERGCSAIQLVATALGEPVYRKLGFRTVGMYCFLRGPLLPPTGCAPASLSPEDADAVLELDREAMGEDRAPTLKGCLAQGVLSRHGATLEAAYLTQFGAGAIVARDAEAGLRLLRERAARETTVVIPSANAVALRAVERWGHREERRAPRMCLGPEPGWRPEQVFARGTGYCG